MTDKTKSCPHGAYSWVGRGTIEINEHVTPDSNTRYEEKQSRRRARAYQRAGKRRSRRRRPCGHRWTGPGRAEAPGSCQKLVSLLSVPKGATGGCSSAEGSNIPQYASKRPLATGWEADCGRPRGQRSPGRKRSPETVRKARPGWALTGTARRQSHKRRSDVKVRPEAGFAGRADVPGWMCGKENGAGLSSRPKSPVTNGATLS